MGSTLAELDPDALCSGPPRSCTNMFFEIIGKIRQVETFARGYGIREIDRLHKIYGAGNWRKRKGIASVRLLDGTMRLAELHWYEATGIGKREFKIKRYLD